jgi:glyoxylase-like metal-dependent hydrolase (beta-lactamase superfamily II)
MIGVRRILAPNPGPYTGPGTNTYVVSSAGQAVVLDPGPEIPSHLDAIEEVLAGSTPVAVVVTHTHSDHAPAANGVARALGVPAAGYAPGPGFVPDLRLGDGDVVAVGDEVLEAVHTPGHTADHLCFLTGDGLLFTGDHIMGGSTVIIEDAAAYLDSLRRLQRIGPRVLYPGHGERMDDAPAVIAGYIEHRLERERQIVDAVDRGARTFEEIVDAVYAELDPRLRPAASSQVEVQVRKLEAEGRVRWDQGAAEYGGRVEPAGEANS